MNRTDLYNKTMEFVGNVFFVLGGLGKNFPNPRIGEIRPHKAPWELAPMEVPKSHRDEGFRAYIARVGLALFRSRRLHEKDRGELIPLYLRVLALHKLVEENPNEEPDEATEDAAFKARASACGLGCRLLAQEFEYLGMSAWQPVQKYCTKESPLAQWWDLLHVLIGLARNKYAGAERAFKAWAAATKLLHFLTIVHELRTVRMVEAPGDNEEMKEWKAQQRQRWEESGWEVTLAQWLSEQVCPDLPADELKAIAKEITLSNPDSFLFIEHRNADDESLRDDLIAATQTIIEADFPNRSHILGMYHGFGNVGRRRPAAHQRPPRRERRRRGQADNGTPESPTGENGEAAA